MLVNCKPSLMIFPFRLGYSLQTLPLAYAGLVLQHVDLWPIWKASLIAAAAACLWHFNSLWALALPLTSVTGIKVQIPSNVLLGYILAE